MNLFISWSGVRSKTYAEALHKWLPRVIQNVKPWLSTADIEKGSRWLKEIGERLEDTDFGILCLTPDNMKSEWLLFEAGALSKALDESSVCPILFGFESSVLRGPLSQFQTTKFEKQDMYKLMISINKAMGDTSLTETHLEETFNLWWPKLEKSMEDLTTPEIGEKLEQSEYELLVEVLRTVRRLDRRPDLSLGSGVSTQKQKSPAEYLTPREEKILRMRFKVGEREQATSEDIANLFDISTQEVDQIIAKSIRKLFRADRSPAKVVCDAILEVVGETKNT